MMSYWGGNSTTYNRDGFPIEVTSYARNKVKAAYAGYEVGGHSASHPDLMACSTEQLETEIKKSNKVISNVVGYTIRGFSYPGNGYNDTVIQYLMDAGIAYSRTTNSTHDFKLPSNAYEFMKWDPTCCDQEASAPSLVRKCAENDVMDLQCYYVWGHAFDLKKPDPYTPNGTTGQRWDDLEAILKTMSEAGNFWCATNIEVRDYVMATYKLFITETSIENRSDMTVYGKLNGETVEIKAGTTLSINK